MSKLSSVAFALVLGLTGCVLEDENAPPPPGDEGEDPEEVVVPTDPPGENIPGPGDEGCGAALKADGPCTP